MVAFATRRCREVIFHGEEDHRVFLKTLGYASKRTGWLQNVLTVRYNVRHRARQRNGPLARHAESRSPRVPSNQGWRSRMTWEAVWVPESQADSTRERSRASLAW